MTVGVNRSDISAYHEPFNGTPAGQLPLICNLLGGVFNHRPLQVRFTFNWDVENIPKYLKQISHNKNLSVKDLTLKLKMLLAPAAVSRCSKLKYLSTKFMTKSNDK